MSKPDIEVRERFRPDPDKFVKVINRKTSDPDLNDSEFRLLVALDKWAWGEAVWTFPSNASIAVECGWFHSGTGDPAVSKVKRLLGRLEDRGYIRRKIVVEDGQYKRKHIGINRECWMRPEMENRAGESISAHEPNRANLLGTPGSDLSYTGSDINQDGLDLGYELNKLEDTHLAKSSKGVPARSLREPTLARTGSGRLGIAKGPGEEDEVSSQDLEQWVADHIQDVSTLRLMLDDITDASLSLDQKNRRAGKCGSWFARKFMDEGSRRLYIKVAYRVIRENLSPEMLITAYDATMRGVWDGKVGVMGATFMGLIKKLEGDAALDVCEEHHRELGDCYPPTTGKL